MSRYINVLQHQHPWTEASHVSKMVAFNPKGVTRCLCWATDFFSGVLEMSEKCTWPQCVTYVGDDLAPRHLSRLFCSCKGIQLTWVYQSQYSCIEVHFLDVPTWVACLGWGMDLMDWFWSSRRHVGLTPSSHCSWVLSQVLVISGKPRAGYGRSF